MGHEAVQACAYCEAQSHSSCDRCGNGLCRKHVPGPAQRCDECEADFRTDRIHRAVVHAAKTAGLTALLLGLVGVLTLGTGVGALALAPLILFSSIPLTLLKLELDARDRFLQESIHRELPRAQVRLLNA